MSLGKTFYVACDGYWLQSRQGLNYHIREHKPTSPQDETSAKARRQAKRLGWTRVTKTLPVNDRPGAPTSALKFDLCPACSKALLDR